MCKHEGTFCSMCDREIDAALAARDAEIEKLKSELNQAREYLGYSEDAKDKSADEIEKLRAMAKALIDALPKCTVCGAIATGEGGGGMGDPDEPECDKHGGDNYEYAEPLRALAAALSAGKAGE